MSVNLISLSVNGVPIDEVKAIKNKDSVYELPLNFEASYPPESTDFIDNPNVHIKTQNGGFYPREKLYKSKGNTNIESNINDGFAEVRRKNLNENSTKTSVLINPELTKTVIQKNMRSKSFDEYPRKMDFGPNDKPYQTWKEDKITNIILEDSYPSTCENRGRSAISYNENLVFGKLLLIFVSKIIL
jgi:hypothetical protein